jgi:hypothetical protein
LFSDLSHHQQQDRSDPHWHPAMLLAQHQAEFVTITFMIDQKKNGKKKMIVIPTNK